MEEDAEFQLMYEHAAWSYDPERETALEGRERCAQEHAAALRALRDDDGVIAVWEKEDPCACAEVHDDDGPYWLCELWDLTEGRPVHSLGCIDLGDADPQDHPYARCIEAELYVELERLRG